MILPASALKDISRLKLPFPLVFRVANERLKTANTVPTATGKLPPSTVADQYAGVFEFSAPEGTVLVPAWMMANLKLREGGKVCFTSARGLPQASYAKFRPHSQAFVDLAAEIGPRDLLEAAMRNYSVLSQGASLRPPTRSRLLTLTRPHPPQASASSWTWPTRHTCWTCWR